MPACDLPREAPEIAGGTPLEVPKSPRLMDDLTSAPAATHRRCARARVRFQAVVEQKRAMRKRYRVLLLAATVAAFVVPVGFALSLESAPAREVPYTPVATATPAVAAPALIAPTESAAASILHSLPDGAKLFVVGGALLGLAAVVRRAV